MLVNEENNVSPNEFDPLSPNGAEEIKDEVEEVDEVKEIPRSMS